jgi:hypothetical protein
VTSSPDRARGFRGAVLRATERLNNLTRGYLGPAQVGEERRPTVVSPIQEQTAACPRCGNPLSQHDLVPSETGRQRLYCPRPASSPPSS